MSKENITSKDDIDSIGVSFFGLTDKDLSVFDRVIEFVAKKGIHLHKCLPKEASLFVVNDTVEATKAATQQRSTQITILISENETTSDSFSCDYQLARPLLVTRVMRAMDDAAKECGEVKQTENSDQHQLKPESTGSNETTNENNLNINIPQSSFHALVVDDSAAIRKQLEIELRETSISADYADCGETALEMINSQQYDLIFLDIIMPGINGYEVCHRIRKMSNYKKTPVIMLSGKTEPLDEVEGILAGASTYLLKPVKHQDFQNTLNRISRWLSEYAPVKSDTSAN